MGTPDFSVPFLMALVKAKFSVTGVITRPDKPRGRGQELSPSPVKAFAMEHGIPVETPKTLRDGTARALLASWSPLVIVVVAYGKILPPDILSLPPFGCVNVHASILPAFRGASPIVWAVRQGALESGVTLMLMDEGMDTGPVLDTLTFPLSPGETSETLSQRMMDLGPDFLVGGLTAYLKGMLKPVAQTGESSMAPLIRKEDGRLSFLTMTRGEVDRHVRSMNPWPGSFVESPFGVLRIYRGEPVDLSGKEGLPGEVIEVFAGGIVVGCKSGSYRILEIQRPGGRRLPVREFLSGTVIPPGVFLG